MLNEPEIRVKTVPERKTVELRNKKKGSKANAEHKGGHLVPPFLFCDHNGDRESMKPDPSFKEKTEVFVKVDFLVDQAPLKSQGFKKYIFGKTNKLPGS